MIFTRIASLFLAVLVLASSVGVVINNHYCSSTKTLKQSIFNKKISCNHAHREAHSCEKSCHNECHKSHETETRFESADCCVDYTIFLRLKEAFNVSNSFDQIFNHFLAVSCFFDATKIVFNEESPLKIIVKQLSPPPLLFGKEKVIAFSQLKIGNLFL